MRSTANLQQSIQVLFDLDFKGHTR